MNLRSIDLNLLVVLEALVDARSVSRAADRIGLTQSAVSHALRRLRATCNDEILVRTATGMAPTPYAVELAAAVSASLRGIESAIERGRNFEPAQAQHEFVLRVSDYVAVYLLPRLIQRLQTEAPFSRLQVRPFDPRQSEPGERGEVQVRLAAEAAQPAGSASLRVLEDRFVVLMRPGHPLAREAFTLDDYLACSHLKIAWAGVGSNAIDDALARLGLRRRVAVTAPSWLEMREVIRGTDLVAVAPSRWLALEGFAGFAAYPLPIEGIALQVDLTWDPRDTRDAAHAWFRAMVQEILGAL